METVVSSTNDIDVIFFGNLNMFWMNLPISNDNQKFYFTHNGILDNTMAISYNQNRRRIQMNTVHERRTTKSSRNNRTINLIIEF